MAPLYPEHYSLPVIRATNQQNVYQITFKTTSANYHGKTQQQIDNENLKKLEEQKRKCIKSSKKGKSSYGPQR